MKPDMRMNRFPILRILESLCLISGLCLASWTLVRAQAIKEEGSSSKSVSASGQEPKLTAQQSRGEALFVQRCSVCHLPRKIKTGSPPMKGPDLKGVFNKNLSPTDEELLMNQIRKGSPNMPGFQYGLDAKEMEDLVAFLKTW